MHAEKSSALRRSMFDENSAGAVIFRKENREVFYLVLHYEEGHWDFVKGKIERGETEERTVTREAEEETGITSLRFIPGFREKIAYSYKRKGKLIKKQVILFLAETRHKEIRLSYEHVGFKWLGFDDAVEQLTYENAKNTLQKADKFLKGNSQTQLPESD